MLRYHTPGFRVVWVYGGGRKGQGWGSVVLCFFRVFWRSISCSCCYSKIRFILRYLSIPERSYSEFRAEWSLWRSSLVAKLVADCEDVTLTKSNQKRALRHLQTRFEFCNIIYKVDLEDT
jgi:hypothetical protein